MMKIVYPNCCENLCGCCHRNYGCPGHYPILSSSISHLHQSIEGAEEVAAIPAFMFAWNPPGNIGPLSTMFLNQNVIFAWRTQNTSRQFVGRKRTKETPSELLIYTNMIWLPEVLFHR